MCEIYPTVCGEGFEKGVPAIFVRTSKCGVGCAYCDSTYTFSGGKFLTPAEILEEVLKVMEKKMLPENRNVFITGGEPTVAKHLDLLIIELRRELFKVLLQTSARLFRPEVFDIVNYLSVDVKGPSAKLKEDVQKACMANVEKIYLKYVAENDLLPVGVPSPAVQFKFNVGDDVDYDFFLDWARSHRHASIYVQPLAPSSGEAFDVDSYNSKYQWLLRRVREEKDEAVKLVRGNPLDHIAVGDPVGPGPIKVGFQEHKLFLKGVEEFEAMGGVRY